MAVFFVTAFLVVVFALAVLLLVASEAAGRAGADQTQLARRLRRVLRHLNGEAEPPAVLASTLIVRDDTAEVVVEQVDQARVEAAAAPIARTSVVSAVAEAAPAIIEADDVDESQEVSRHLAA